MFAEQARAPVVRNTAAVIRETLGPRARQVDSIIVEYIINVLKDETFDFGRNGEEAFDFLGALLVDSGCSDSEAQAREFCSRLSTSLNRSSSSGRGSGAEGEGAETSDIRSLSAPVRMAGQEAAEPTARRPAGAKGVNAVTEGESSFVSERDAAKLERRKRKEEREQQMVYAAHMAASQAALHALPQVLVQHGAAAEGGGASKDLRLQDFSIIVAGKELISDASLTLAFGRRYGLVGRNGTGKTTLLKHLAAHAVPGIPRSCQVLHVEQEVAGDDLTVLQCVLSADSERAELLREEAQLTAQQQQTPQESDTGAAAAAPPPPPSASKGDKSSSGAPAGAGESGDAVSDRLAVIWKRLEAIDAYTAEARAATILAGLSFEPEMQQQATKTFSGGWRMRVALARALFIEPDLLLLDEPTNHLDLHAVLWLEAYLLKWPKTLIVVSHAREFLNTVVTDVLHLHNQKLISYKGNYDTFEKTRDERIRNQQKAKEASDRTRSHIQEFIDKFRYNAKRASLVQSRIKALERLGTVDAVMSDPEYRFEFPTPDDRPSAPIVSFTDVSFAYPGGGPQLFKGLSFGLDLDSRLAMVGPNGIGKSTLLKLISGELKPTEGTVFKSGKVRLAVFSQHHVDGLDLSKSPLLYMAHAFPGVPEQKLRGHLGSFGVSGTLALQPMYTLSGGQKSRVAFAKITMLKPHILLLDEPSNHLDLDAVEALIAGLAMFQGGVLMVSHDEHLISGCVDELWVVNGGKARPFHGTFREYKKTLRA
eukprot:TRINITY_DN15071_c0_g2_i1.p1 TRINITY_DN15071_c0_g2~~TRINITY_DN15071_c0_g2_i1.p1  ORF type:complete len:764 (-),score=206.39 TRINITY_DN15071_c0_g2_i1:552-2843(-)